MKKKIFIVLLAVALLLVGCGGGNTPPADDNTGNEAVNNEAVGEETNEGAEETPADFDPTMTFNGSSTLAPVISSISTDFIEEYGTWDKVDENLPEENIAIYVSAGGSGAGAKSVIDGTGDFGMLAREVKEEEKAKIEDYQEFKLGIDALTISVNPENKVTDIKGNLTTDELQKIFSGEYKLWSDLDPALDSEEIVVVTRDLGGGAHSVFQDNVMGDKQVREDAIQAPSMGALVQKVMENKNAIGYASFGMVQQNEGKLIPLSVDGTEATKENIQSGEYKISRPLLVIHSGELTETQKLFVDVLTGETGQAKIEEMGFVPVQ